MILDLMRHMVDGSKGTLTAAALGQAIVRGIALIALVGLVVVALQ